MTNTANTARKPAGEGRIMALHIEGDLDRRIVERSQSRRMPMTSVVYDILMQHFEAEDKAAYKREMLERAVSGQ